MPLSLRSPEDVVNAALGRIGHAHRIGDLFEGSEAAQTAIDIYAQTRDELLRSQDWDFSQREVNLTLLKQAPVGGYGPWAPWDPTQNPTPGWAYEYAYPDDCLRVRSVQPQPGFLIDFDPQPYIWKVENDNNYTPAVRVILCQVGSAILTYVGQITDPLTWNSLFAEALIAALAKRLAPVLSQIDQERLADERAEASDEAITAANADVSQG